MTVQRVSAVASFLEVAPALQVIQWFDTAGTLSLDALRVGWWCCMLFKYCALAAYIAAFHKCNVFNNNSTLSMSLLIALHTVFEHHNVMSPEALEVFIHENRLTFPIGIDAPDGRGGVPLTKRAYKIQGTPTLILIDRQVVPAFIFSDRKATSA